MTIPCRMMVCALLVALCRSAGAAPDAFLPAPAPTVNALVQQVQGSQTVRNRYARFFHVPEARVADFLRARIMPTRLGHAGRYTEFFVRAGGTIYPAVTPLAPGQRAYWIEGTGTLLLAQTGNPLRPFAPVTETITPPPVVQTMPPRQRVVPMKAQPVVVPLPPPTPVFQTAPHVP